MRIDSTASNDNGNGCANGNYYDHDITTAVTVTMITWLLRFAPQGRPRPRASYKKTRASQQDDGSSGGRQSRVRPRHLLLRWLCFCGGCLLLRRLSAFAAVVAGRSVARAPDDICFCACVGHSKRMAAVVVVVGSRGSSSISSIRRNTEIYFYDYINNSSSSSSSSSNKNNKNKNNNSNNNKNNNCNNDKNAAARGAGPTRGRRWGTSRAAAAT